MPIDTYGLHFAAGPITDRPKPEEATTKGDPLEAARERGRNHPEGELFSGVIAIIERDTNPQNEDGSINGAANEIIALCRKHFTGSR